MNRLYVASIDPVARPGIRGVAAGALLLALLLAAALPAPARAEGSPAISLAVSTPAETLYGSDGTVTLTASNPKGQPYGYNLSFQAVLPEGIEYVAGSAQVGSGGPAIEPVVVKNAPVSGQTTLVWAGVGDLSPSSSDALSFKVSHSTSKYAVGSSYTVHGAAYLNTNPRVVPKFSAKGVAEAASYTASATGSALTTLTAIEIKQSEGSPEGEILRGVHDHQTVYKITVTNTSVSSTEKVSVDDWLPADLEYLGCGGANVDNTTEAPTNPKSAEEYPGSGPIKVATLAGCLTPSLVETVETDPDGSGPDPTAVYTHVRWSLETLAPGETRTFEFRAAVPLRENTTKWTHAEPTPESGKQAVNLDNNSGAETKDGEQIVTYAKASGEYEGKTPVSSSEHLTRIAKDLTTEKSAQGPDGGALNEGQITLWTILVHSSEYRYNTEVTVSDTVPNGLCPLSSTNLTSSAECAPTGKAEDEPSSPYASAVEEANGSWKLVWNRSTDAALGEIAQNATHTITFATRTRTHYQSGHAPAGPVLANDTVTNTVIAAGTTNVVCGGDSDCSGGSKTPIDHERPLSEPVSDNSSASQLGAGPTITKQIAESGTECKSAKYTSSTPVYHPGDVVCWRINVAFPLELDTQGLTVTDFLPLNGLFDAAFNAGKGEAPTEHDTLPGTVFGSSEAGKTEPGGLITWTLPESGHVPSKGQVLERVFATTAELPAAATPGELQGNLLKFASQNTAGESFPLRAEAGFQLQFPQLSLKKQIVQLNGKAVGPTGTQTVKGGDEAKFALTVPNAGKVAAEHVEVWDELPSGLTCEDISAISNKGACISGRISWGETSLGQEEVTVAAEGHAELTFIATVPLSIGPGVSLEDHSGVRTYTSPTNTGEKFTYIPAENIDPTLKETNAVAASAAARLNTENVTIEKTHTSEVNEAGNEAKQATIGEEVTFEIPVKIPAGTTLAGRAELTDPGLPQAGMAYQAASAKLAVSSGTTSGFTIEEGGESPRVLFPENYAAPSGSSVTVTLTIRARILNVSTNLRGVTLTNKAKLAWKDPISGAQTREASDTVPIVEPNISLSESNSAAGSPVHGGQLVKYELTLTNASGASSAWENKVVDTVAEGVTPSNSSGEPLKEGETYEGGTWDEKTRTITWTLTKLATNSSHKFVYYATVKEKPVSGTELKDTAVATTWSLPVESPRARNAANAPGTTKTGYEATAHSELEVAGPTVTKESDSPEGTIGHRIKYTLTVTLPAHVLSYDTTVIDTLPDTLDFDAFVSASCTAGCPPEVTVHSYKPAITPSSSTIAWSLGDLPETSAPRTVKIVYLASIRSTHRNGAARISAGTSITNSVQLYYDKTNKIEFEEGVIPSPGAFDKHSAPVSAKTNVVEPEIGLVKEAAVGSGAYSSANFSIGDGEGVSYRLKVTNNGTSPAYNVKVRDAPSSALVEVSETGKEFVTKAWSSGAPEIEWAIPGPIAPKATVTLAYTAKLAPIKMLKDEQAVNNEATVPSYFGTTEAERGEKLTNFEKSPILYREYTGPAAKVEGKVALPKIKIEKTTGAEGFPTTANAEVAQPFTWRVVVTNTSTVAATKLKIQDALPVNWEYDTASATFTPGGAVAPAVTGTVEGGQHLTWSTEIALAAGHSTVLTYTATPTIAAATNPGIGVSHPSENAASASVLDAAGNPEDAEGPFAAGPSTAKAILLLPGLEITKKPVKPSAVAGVTEEDAYEVAVTNAGTGLAREVIVADTLPEGMTYKAGSATAIPSSGFSEEAHNARSVTWTIANLAAGKTVTIKMPVTVEAGVGSGAELVNTAAVHSKEQPTPVEASGTIKVLASADVSAEKVVEGAQSATPGEAVAYVITATNRGPSTARAVELEDPLPSGLSYQSGPVGCSASSGTVTCVAGDLQPGAHASFRILALVEAGDTATSVTNTVKASSTTPDPVPANNEATVKVPITPAPELVPVKTALKREVPLGADAVFRIEVPNTGPSDAAGVVATDELPAGLTYVSASGAQCAAEGQTVRCELGTVPGRGTKVFEVTAKAAALGALVNHVSVSTTTEEPDTANNHSEAEVVVIPSADLSILKSASPEQVQVPGQVTYTLKVANAGPSPAVGALATDSLPAGESYAGGEAGCTASGQIVTCQLGEMAVGSERVVHLLVDVALGSAGQTLENSASVTSATFDPEPANNTSTAAVHAAEAADVGVVKSAPASTVTGASITWKLAATNHGPSTATDVVVSDPLPSGARYVSSHSSQGTCAYEAGVVRCSLGTLADGASAAISVTATVTATPGTLVNTASISAQQPDPEPGNNASSVSTLVETPPRVTLKKTANEPYTIKGGSIDYSLLLHNGGPGTAIDLRTCDRLPAHATVISRGGGRLSSGRICFTLARLADGSSHTYSIALRTDSNARGVLVNTAVVTGANFREVRARVSTPIAASGVEAFRVRGVTG